MTKSTLSENRSIDLAERIYNERIAAAKDALNNSISNVERNCPSCGDTRKKVFKLFGWKCGKCEKCLTQYAINVPTSEGLEKFYERVSVLNSQLWSRSRVNEFNEKLNVIQSLDLASNGKISAVELGCGSGEFVNFLNNKDVAALGIELDNNLVTLGKKKGYNIVQGNVVTAYLPEVDVYLCYEIIEHLIDPVDFVRSLFEKMKIGSFLILTTPNSDGYDNVVVSPETSGRFLASSLFPPYHVNAYSVKSLFHLVLKVGFDIVEISTPGKLDISIVNHHTDLLKKLNIDEQPDLAESWQESLRMANGSGHMQFVLKKGTQ